jgi:hypothetical protein
VCRAQLVEDRDFQGISKLALPFEFTQELLNDITSDDEDNCRLHVACGMW